MIQNSQIAGISEFSEIFSTPIRDLPGTRLIQKSKNLLTLLKRDTFYPLSTWPQDNQ